MAAFGRLPRLPEELLSDPHGLVVGESVGENHRKAELYRCEATKAIAGMQASASMRRALLRKTALRGSQLPEVEPWSKIAYWRWQHRAKGSKKKGGFSIGRYLGPDPDGRSCWIHTGSTTARVTPEQLRLATSFEDWTPDEEAIRILKDGAASIRQDLWEDHRGDGPPQQDEMTRTEEVIEGEFGEPELAALPHALPAPAKRKASDDLGEEEAQRGDLQQNINIHNEENVRVEVSVLPQAPLQRAQQPRVRYGMHPENCEFLFYHHHEGGQEPGHGLLREGNPQLRRHHLKHYYQR